jgi:hypothetical protein
MVRAAGVEPATSGSVVPRSIQLSYAPDQNLLLYKTAAGGKCLFLKRKVAKFNFYEACNRKTNAGA